MNDDCEKLTFAAKAAGLNIKEYAVDSDDKFTHLIVGKKFTREKEKWNPTLDDGDALRLAVYLSIFHDFDFSSIKLCHSSDEDAYQAVRDKIVSFAENVGRKMKP